MAMISVRSLPQTFLWNEHGGMRTMTQITVARDGGVLVVAGQGGRWQSHTELTGLEAQCLATHPFRPEVIYCGTFGGGLWRSMDAGSSWQPVGSDVILPQVMSVAVTARDAADAGTVYCGTEPSAFFRSEDGGETWRAFPALQALPSAPTWAFPPRPHTSHVRCITPDARNADRLVVCIEAGALIWSEDRGETWHDRTPDGPWDTHTLRVHANAPGRLYSAAGDGFMRPGRGYAESDDGGLTWRRPDDGLDHHYLWGAAVDPGDPETVVISAASSPNNAHNPVAAESHLYRKQRSAAWEHVQDGLPAPRGMLAASLATNPTEPGLFYAAANTGLFRSPDGGASWERIPIPWQEHDRRHVHALTVTDMP